MASSLVHPLQNAFRTSKPAFGSWITLPGFLNARAVASASPHISWVCVDCEHGMTALHPGAGEIIHAVSGLGPNAPSVLVRIPATGACADGSAAWQIKYVLDSGARGVVVPMVSTRAQAASIVSAARFPPQGKRGFGNPFTQLAWGPGISAADYLTRANEAVIVLVQIETRDAVENLDDILSVEGVDGVFIGPYDLSLSLNLPPPSPDLHPDVEKVVQHILDSCHAKGKKCAFYCSSGAKAAERAKQGFDMVNVINDCSALADGLSRHFSEAVGEAGPAKGFSY